MATKPIDIKSAAPDHASLEARTRKRVLRLDRPEQPGAAPESAPKTEREHLRLLERIVRAFRTNDDDRRSSRRHVVVRPEIWVGWWAGENFGTIDGKLLNISRGGALILLGEWPPKRVPVYVYKDVGEAIACVRGEVIGVIPAPRGMYAARFRFAAPCPTSICEASVCESTSRPVKG
jgi:hypothetical protein